MRFLKKIMKEKSSVKIENKDVDIKTKIEKPRKAQKRKTTIKKTSVSPKNRKQQKLPSLKERFEMNVKKGKACWAWKGSVTGDGYGQIWLSDNVVKKAHRTSFEIYKSKLKTKQRLRNKCGNPKCVNPEHWEILVKKPYVYKGPARLSGEKNGRSVLTEKDVKKIRQLAKRKTYRELSEEYNVSATQISRIVNGITWTKTG